LALKGKIPHEEGDLPFKVFGYPKNGKIIQNSLMIIQRLAILKHKLKLNLITHPIFLN
jgi:hypothetical protein